MSLLSISSSLSNPLNMEPAPSSSSSTLTTIPVKRDHRRHSPALSFQLDDPPQSPSSSLSGDATFEPSIDMMVNDFDDEQTLNEEEALANLESENTEDEIATLKEESEMPIEELLAKYGALPPIPTSTSSRRKPRRHHAVKYKKTTHDNCGDNDEVQQVDDTLLSMRSLDTCNNETEVICIENDHQEDSQKKDSIELDELPVTDKSQETDKSENIIYETTEIQPSAIRLPIAKKPKHSHLLDLYPDQCLGELKPEAGDNQKYLPLEMLYDDEVEGDGDEEEEEDAETESDYIRKTIMVGSAYQAIIPSGLSQYGDILPYENEDKLVWEPSQVTEHEVEEYLVKTHDLKNVTIDEDDVDTEAAATINGEACEHGSVNLEIDNGVSLQKEPTNITQNDNKSTTTTVSDSESVIKDNEQALHLLVQCGYDFKEALRRKRLNALPLSGDGMSSWSEDECQKFEEGIQKYGKDFLKIRQHLVRTRTMREMVQFYYLWKKSDRRDYSFGNADTIDQMDIYLNETGGDFSSNTLHNGHAAGATVAGSTAASTTSTDSKKSNPKNFSIMIGSNQSNQNSVSSSETSPSKAVAGRKRTACALDSNNDHDLSS